MMWKRLAILGVSAAAMTFGVLSILLGRAHPGYWFAGVSRAYAGAELGAGLALVAAGVVAWTRRPVSRFGPLLVAAAFGWFLLEWNNPGVPTSAAFTAGLALYAVAPAIVAHAALAYPGGSVASRLERLGLAAAYAGTVLLLGILP